MSNGERGRTGGWRRLIAAIAIATAVARALIPIGFMPALVHGTAQLVFCEGGGHHHPHITPSGDDPAGHHGSDQGPCLFALSGGAAPLPAALAGAPLAVLADEVAASPTTATLRDAPPRYSAPRGPPARA